MCHPIIFQSPDKGPLSQLEDGEWDSFEHQKAGVRNTAQGKFTIFFPLGKYVPFLILNLIQEPKLIKKIKQKYFSYW